MKYVITLLLTLVTITGMAQTEEQSSPDDRLKWAAGGLLMLMAPDWDPHYYDKDTERYVPPTPMIWLGALRLSDGMMRGAQSQFHLRDGFLRQMDGGFTLLQFSRNLYRGIAGYTVGLQFEGSTYKFSRYCIAKSEGNRVEFVSSDSGSKEHELNTYSARIPLLVGIQTPRRWLSLQTGLGLYAGGSDYRYRAQGMDKSEKHRFHTTHVGAQWLLSAGIGPLTVNYSQNLTPLFTLADGTKAYPSSLTIGFDIWYLVCRLTHSEP